MGRRIGVGAAVGCIAAVLAGPVLAAKPAAPPPDPTALWRAYPLQPPPPRAQPAEPPPRARPAEPPPATVPPPPQARPAEPPSATVPPPAATPPAPAPAAPSQRDDGGMGWRWLAFALSGVGVLVAAGASIAVVALRRRPPATSPEPVAARPPRATPDALIAQAYALANEAAECNTFLHRQQEGGTEDMTETTEQEAPGEAATEPPKVATKYADIGDRVAGVLSAAEDAAQQIRTEARSEADGLLSAARTEADGIRREAEAYDDEVRTAVETFASERRREADADVQRLLTESEAQARATRQAAEAMARQIEEDGIRRGQALRDESQAVEERLKKALVSFRRITAELEELVGTGAPSSTGESLADALRPYGHGQDRKPLAAVPADDA